MASKVVSRRLIASLSVVGLLLSTLLVIVPMTAPAVEQTNASKATSATANSTGNKSAKSSANTSHSTSNTNHSSAATDNSQAKQFNFQQTNAGVPQALRVPAPMRQGVPPTDDRFTFNGTELTGLTDKGKTALDANKELTIPAGTTKIAEGVFSGLELTKVTLPDSVTEVADRAFYDNEISELTAPGLKTIGEGAFQKNKLTAFESSTVETIGEGSFSDNALKTVKIKDAPVTAIPANTFRDNQLETVELPDTVTEIGASAFANNKLKGVTLPSKLAKVGQEAFSGNQIEKVKIPATITEFGPEVFANNQRWVVLEKADGQQALPDAVRSTKYDSGFGQVVAEDAVSITVNYIDADTNKPLRSPQVLQSEFTDPDGVYFAGEENTIEAPQLAGYAVTPDFQKITPQAGEANEVTFKYKKTDFSPKISGEIVKHIDKGKDGSKEALLAGVTATDADGNDITDSLTVSPESIDTSVQEATYDVYYTATDFKGRTKTVKGKVAVGPDWPEKTICPGWQIKDFKYHTWTDSKGKQWNSVAGFSTTGLAKYRAGKTKNSTDWCWPTIGDKGQPIDSISEDAFRSTPLTSVPDSWGNIEYIGMRAFLNSKLTALPDSWGKVKTIQYYAFQNNQLTALPKSWGDVSYLGNEAFRDNKITALEAPWGKITDLPEGVFRGNEIVSVPDSWGDITSIGRGAFSDNRLTALPDSWGKVSTLGQSAFYNNKITALKAPWGNITTLPTSVFENNLLTSLPASWGKITTIGNKAFSQNSYNKSESMVLPDSWGEVTSIGDSAFENNPNTTLPASWGKVSKVGSRAFKNNKLKTVPNSWGKITALPESVFEKNEISSLPDDWGLVSSLGESVFASNKLTALPDSWGKITTIPKKAFYDNQLASLPAWGAITSIGQAAFHRNRLTVLPDSWDNVTTIEPCAFAGKKVYDDGTYPDFQKDNSCYSAPGSGDSNFNQIQSLPSSWGKVKTIGFQAFMGNALTGLPDSWGEVSTLGEECFKDNKITALTAPWDTFTEIPRGVFLNNEITTLPSSWGNLKDIGSYAFTNNRIQALPDSWGEVEYIRYGAFANNALTSLPDSWGNVKSLGTRVPYKDRPSRNEPAAGVFGKNRKLYDPNNPVNTDKDKNRITSLPDSLENIVELGKNTFYGMPIEEPVFTVPDAPLDKPDSDLKHPYNRLERVKALFTETWWGGELNSYAGFSGPVYLRPESGKNPDNITGYGGDRGVIILTDSQVRVRYLDQETGQPLAPEINRPISSKEGDSNQNYVLVPPMIKGYSLPPSQTIKLDGNDKDIVFRYQKAPAEMTGSYARLDLTGRINQLGWPESNELEEEFGNNMRVDLTYGGDAGTSIVKDGVIRVTYDPTRVEFADYDRTSPEIFTSVKVVAPGVLEVKLKSNYDASKRYTIPIYWRIKKRITASDAVFPLKAELVDTAADGKRYVLTPHPESKPGPVNLKGYYPLPSFTKDTVGCYLAVCRDYDDDPEGDVSTSGKNAVTFTFEVKDLMRNVRGYTITDELPLYTKTDGTQARAKFVASENPGWELGDDKITLTYTNTEKRLHTESSGLGSLKLHFPGAKKQKRIDNHADFILTPEEQGPEEPLLTGAADTYFSFYKPMETAPPGVPLTKVAAGPHFRDGAAVIYDTKQNRDLEIDWNVLTNNITDTAVTLNLRDFDLDERLQYTGITPDPVFVGGTLEIISPTGTGEEAKKEGPFKVLYSMGITGTDRIDLPEDLTSYQNIQLRWSSVKATQPGQKTITKIHTKLRNPDSNLCEELKCQADLRNKVQGGKRIKEDHVKVLPEGKKLKARKVNTFDKATLAGKTGTYTVGAELETDYGDPLTGFELVDVLPRGLEVNRVTLTKKFAELPGARYQILSNFNGTGRVAVRFQADQVTDPSQVYSVGQLETTITRGVSDGDIVNEAFVHAQGKVEYPEDKSDRNKDRWATTVKDPIAGSGTWSRAENTTRVAVGDGTYIYKRIKERKPNAPWVTEIKTVGGAKFDYQLRLGYGTNPEQNPVIYDLLPVAGTPARSGSTLINQYDPSGQISFEMVDGTAANGWNTFYTCDTGIAKDNLDRANWQSAPCPVVTGLKFTNNNPQQPRSEVRITVPMIAGPVGADPRSQEHLGKKAINDFWSLSSSHAGKLESNPVINTLVPPAVNIELTKYGYKAEPFQTAQKKLLAGAKFGLYDKEGALQASAISDSKGQVKFTNVTATPGWTVREIEAPTGYAVTDKAYMLSASDFNATNYDSTTGTYKIKLPDVTNIGKWYPLEPITGTAEFKKVDALGNPLAGIEFTITPQPVRQNDGTMFVPNSAPITVRSNDDGLVKFYRIPAGKWQLTENPGVRHLQPIAPIDFTITSCSQATCTNLRGLDLKLGVNGQIKNDKGAVSLSKLGVRGMADKNKSFGEWQRGDGVIKAGATFNLYKGKGTSSLVKSVTTGGSAANVILDNLDINQVYTLQETKAPEGYTQNSELMYFQIDPDGRLLDASGKLLLEQRELLVPNEEEKQESSLVVTKVDPTADETDKFLQGAEFGLFKQADGVWPETPVEVKETNDAGQVEFAGLAGGVYRVKELKAPAGYFVDPGAVHEFVVDDYKAQKFTWTANNNPSRLRVFKYEPLVKAIDEDAADKVVSGTPGAVKVPGKVAGTFDVVIPLKGAKFTLFEEDETTEVASGLVTGDDGLVELPATVKLDPDKVYKLKEVTAPSGYVAKSNAVSVRVSDYALLDGFTGLITMEVPNTKNTGRITVSKLSEETGKALAGAEFTLTKPDGSTQKLVTNEVGLATFTGLDFDKEYAVQETKAPSGYLVSDEVSKVTLTGDNPTVTFVRYNQRAEVEIELNKVSDEGDPLEGVVFELSREGDSGDTQTLTTGKDGKVKFKVLPNQEYTLRETQTNRGYALLPQPVKFTVDGNGKVTVSSEKGNVNTVSGGDRSLTVTNYPEGKLPLSGYAGALEVLLLGCLVLGIAIVFTLFERKRK